MNTLVAEWISSTQKHAPVNVPCLFKVKEGVEPEITTNVVYGWVAASDGHLELRGYYRDFTMKANTEYEWVMLPK